jgi:hypothetical protein
VPVERHTYGRVFTAGVGTVEAPIDDDWRAEDQDYLWFSAQNRQVSKGDHMFALAAGRRSLVVGLFEVTSGGFARRRAPREWDPTGRWPYVLAVRALCGVEPARAVSVDGVRAPRRAAAQITDPAKHKALYDAVDLGP